MFDYKCPVCPFTSTGWPSKEEAQQTGKAHETEHKTGEPMPELADRRTTQES